MTAFVRDGLTHLLQMVDAHIRSNEEDLIGTTDANDVRDLNNALRELGHERRALRRAMSDLGIEEPRRS